MNRYPHYGNYKTFTHVYTDEKIDKYTITCNTYSQYQKYIESYKWRMMEDHLVNTLYLNQHHIEDICSTTYQADIFIQHIPVRLDHFSDIQYPDNLYFIQAALDGFGKLYEKVGYFSIREDQICLDEEGILKVWVNSDLSKNYPNLSDLHPPNQTNTQTLIVSEIFKIIDRNTDHATEPISILKFLENKKIYQLTFQQATNLLQAYTHDYTIKIPTQVKSIVEQCLEKKVQSDVSQVIIKNQSNDNLKPNQPLHKHHNENQHREAKSLDQKYIAHDRVKHQHPTPPYQPAYHHPNLIKPLQFNLQLPNQPISNRFYVNNNRVRSNSNPNMQIRPIVASSQKVSFNYSPNKYVKPMPVNTRPYDKISPVGNLKYFFSEKPTNSYFQSRATIKPQRSSPSRLRRPINQSKTQLIKVIPNWQIPNYPIHHHRQSIRQSPIKRLPLQQKYIRVINKSVDKTELKSKTIPNSNQLGNKNSNYQPQTFKNLQTNQNNNNSITYFTKNNEIALDPQIAADLKLLNNFIEKN